MHHAQATANFLKSGKTAVNSQKIAYLFVLMAIRMVDSCTSGREA
jgi:hypothetical protein